MRPDKKWRNGAHAFLAVLAMAVFVSTGYYLWAINDLELEKHKPHCIEIGGVWVKGKGCNLDD